MIKTLNSYWSSKPYHATTVPEPQRIWNSAGEGTMEGWGESKCRNVTASKDFLAFSMRFSKFLLQTVIQQPRIFTVRCGSATYRTTDLAIDFHPENKIWITRFFFFLKQSIFLEILAYNKYIKWCDQLRGPVCNWFQLVYRQPIGRPQHIDAHKAKRADQSTLRKVGASGGRLF